MSRITERLPSAVLLIVSCALWGGATVMNKALLVAIPPVSLLGALKVLAIAAFILRERMTRALLSVIVVGVLGVALVANLREDVASADNHLAGILLLLSAVLCCAFYTVFARNPNVSTVILGASKKSQLEDNLSALKDKGKLTPDVLAEIDAMLGNKPPAPERY